MRSMRSRWTSTSSRGETSPRRRSSACAAIPAKARSFGSTAGASVPVHRIGRVEEIVYDERGLVPCVVQDWNTGEVLTLAYVNQEALERTRATGQMHFFSRSRQELWHKGATSGNTMQVRAIRYECDGD